MAIKETPNEPSTIRQQLYKDFWMQFNRFAASDERFTTEFKIHQYADVRKYQDYSIGQRPFHLNSLIDFKKKECKVGVYFRDVDIWKNYYDARDIIEQNIGNNLVWAVHKTKGSAYLITQLSAFDERNRWNDAFEIIISNLVLLKKEFLRHSHLYRTNRLLHRQNAFNNDNTFYDEIEKPEDIYEGAKKTIVVNSYERNREARNVCIAAHGCKCSVCGMDFEKMYGEIGHDFIHVHHIIPISTIGEEYKIDPIRDLVPVCPNCHAMLHRGRDGEVLTIDELKEIIATYESRGT